MKKEIAKIKEPVFYITNDVSRGIGLEKILPNYHIICLDEHPLVDYLIKEGVSVFCLERELGKKNEILRNAGTILSHSLVLDFIKEKSEGQKPNILFFKPQKKIELIAKKYHFNLIGNSADLSRFFEDKINFLKICQENDLKVSSGEIIRLGKASYTDLQRRFGEKPVIQFGRGWAGNSTFFVESEEELENLKKENGNIEVRAGRFINGITVLNNAVIYGDGFFISPPAVQVKAEQILTSTQGGTGGRQWPAQISLKQKEEIEKITAKVAGIMKKKGYKGLFGLDYIIEEETGEVFLSEDNARITASIPFYTKLELSEGSFPLLGFHLLAFLKPGERIDYQGPEVSGGEIVARNNRKKSMVVQNEVKNGIYSKDLSFLRESYFLDSTNKEEFWLETAAQGRVVNPEIEIIKLNTKDEVCDRKGRLKSEYSQIIFLLKEKLGLKCIS
ncbi:hypothetical protein C4578_00050 [Candidatus Microgenomates bacterium]|jgi:hypothetical protein|nr:MAG: hypothetical protein C4578_00050 [Candidatus Microgenomates bacterium]